MNRVPSDGSRALAGTRPHRRRAVSRFRSALRRITVAKRMGVTVSTAPGGAPMRSASVTSSPQLIICVNFPHMGWALVCAGTGIAFHYHMVSRKEWNRLAKNFEREVCDITRETRGNQIGRLVAGLKPSSQKSVLVDLGCGIGTFVERYGRLFRATFAVEHAPRIIARAKKRLAKRTDVTWLTSNIPPATRRIGALADLTVCMNVITMPRPKTRERMWDGISHVTKKRGHALIVVPSIESDRMVERVA